MVQQSRNQAMAGAASQIAHQEDFERNAKAAFEQWGGVAEARQDRSLEMQRTPLARPEHLRSSFIFNIPFFGPLLFGILNRLFPSEMHREVKFRQRPIRPLSRVPRDQTLPREIAGTPKRGLARVFARKPRERPGPMHGPKAGRPRMPGWRFRPR